MKVTDVLVGELFEWRGNRYSVRFHNRNCAQANRQLKNGFSKTYTIIHNREDVTLIRSALGREHLVEKVKIEVSPSTV